MDGRSNWGSGPGGGAYPRSWRNGPGMPVEPTPRRAPKVAEQPVNMRNYQRTGRERANGR